MVSHVSSCLPKVMKSSFEIKIDLDILGFATTILLSLINPFIESSILIKLEADFDVIERTEKWKLLYIPIS